MKKPVIGIASIFLTEKDGIIRSYVNDDYIEAVELAGGIPIILPVVNEKENIESQIELCDGIILPGGQDVNPLFYHEEPHMKLSYVCSKVDEYQTKLAQMSLESDLPVLGICRGLQLLNVVCGGTLYQDLSEISSGTIKHVQDSVRHEYSHRIKTKQKSIIGCLLGSEALVNSFHHQCIKEPGKDLEVTATASDEVIEAVEMKNKKFVVGVQWHPEGMAARDEKMLGIFKELISQASK